MKKITIALIIVFAASAIGHAFALPQASRCFFIDLYSFERDGDIYFRSSVPNKKKEELKLLVSLAEERVALFWGEKLSTPKFIYCENEEDYLKFGGPFLTPAAAVMHIGSYVVISKDGVDLDIISHELSHTELFERIGLVNRSMKIPVWFDEGLAMQVDHRPYYSLDSLKELSNNFKNLPNVKSLEGYSSFGSGSREEVMMNYLAAKFELHNWYTAEKLERFIFQINHGASFEESY